MTNRNPLKAMAFLAVPTALLLMAQPVLAEPFPAGKQIAQAKPDREARQQQLIQQLGMSPEQGQKVKALMQQGRDQSRSIHQQLRSKRQAMMTYLQSPDANESKARTMNAEINDLQRQLSEIRLKSWFAMRTQMTPQQLKKLSQLKRPGDRAQHGGSEGMRPHKPNQPEWKHHPDSTDDSPL